MVARIDTVGLRSGVRFGVMALVILPLLPAGPYGPLGGVRPRELWMLVLFFSGLSFAGYVSRSLVGPGHGYLVTGLLGGMVSSTNVTFTFARSSRSEPALSRELATGAVAANANVAAPILLAQALHAATPRDAEAVVINLLDQKLYNLNPDYLSYTLSKAALHTATTMLAQALAPTVRVVGVAPGITLVSGDQSEDGFAKAHQATPLGQSSRPHDIVDAVVYLAGARAVTGTTLLVDGGQHLMPLPRDVMFLTK